MEGFAKPINPKYVLDVLYEIWGRENGYKIKVTLTPKEEQPKKDVTERK